MMKEQKRNILSHTVMDIEMQLCELLGMLFIPQASCKENSLRIHSR